MRLIIHTPESGDWTVIQDENGHEIYSGHDRFNQLAYAVLMWANDQVEIEHIVWTDEAFEQQF